MTGARILQINTSPGGLPKTPVEEARVEAEGITTDVQRNRKYHGGPRQALLLIASEMIDALAADGFGVFYGALGENITTAGLDHRAWRSGQRYRLGAEVVIEFTKLRQPCQQLNPYGAGIQKRLHDQRAKDGDPGSACWAAGGFYCSILTPGTIRPGDAITLLPA
jgi:MOSC domain-containing protein YiiM